MEIQFKGHACFLLKSENNIKIITDPWSGIKPVEAEIVTISHQAPTHNATALATGNPHILNWPGEYEIKGIAMTGIAADDLKNKSENIIYLFFIDQIKICHLGDFNLKLTSELLDQIGNIDILLLPVGGQNALDAEKAKTVVDEIDPRIVIPMHYKMDESDLPLGTLNDFLRKMGKSGIEPKDVFKVTKSQLPAEETEIVVLNVK